MWFQVLEGFPRRSNSLPWALSMSVENIYKFNKMYRAIWIKLKSIISMNSVMNVKVRIALWIWKLHSLKIEFKNHPTRTNQPTMTWHPRTQRLIKPSKFCWQVLQSEYMRSSASTVVINIANLVSWYSSYYVVDAILSSICFYKYRSPSFRLLLIYLSLSIILKLFSPNLSQ